MKITSGKIKRPHLILCYGIDGAGKSTFASTYPAPIFVGPESGSDNLDTSRFEGVKTYKDVLLAIEFLEKENHEYKTLVIDSLDWIEPLLYGHLLEKYKGSVIEDIGGGYGKWVNIMLNEWNDFILKLNHLRDIKKMNIVLIAHYHIKSFNDPASSEPYERYMIKLQEKTSAKFREWVDCVLFFNFETFTKKDRGMSKAKAFSDGERYIFTQKTAAYDAKNRFGLPAKMKLGTFTDFEIALNGASISDIELLKTEIDGLMLDVKDNELLEKIKTSLIGADYNKLTAIKNRIQEIL